MILSGAGRVLIVEDDDDTRWLLVHACKAANYAVVEAASGREALEKIESEPIDVMLLDLMLPDIYGVDVLDKVAQSESDLITIVLTANPTQDSAIAAIRNGAADYLRKPLRVSDVLGVVAAKLAERALRQRRMIELGELGAKVVGHMEFGSGEQLPQAEESAPNHRVGPRLVLDAIKHEVKIVGAKTERVPLTKGETQVLGALLRRSGEVMSFQELALQAWGDQLEDEHAASIIRPLIFRLRQKLERDPSVPNWIRTVRGVGYVLNRTDT